MSARPTAPPDPLPCRVKKRNLGGTHPRVDPPVALRPKHDSPLTRAYISCPLRPPASQWVLGEALAIPTAAKARWHASLAGLAMQGTGVGQRGMSSDLLSLRVRAREFLVGAWVLGQSGICTCSAKRPQLGIRALQSFMDDDGANVVRCSCGS